MLIEKKVLVTGGGHAEIPLINALHELGYYVITTGNNTEGLGHRVADEYIQGDFSDCEFVYNLAKKMNVSGIVSGCNDFAYISTAYACERLGFPGHNTEKTAKIIHHKEKFREVLKELNIKHPTAISCANKEEAVLAAGKLGFPCFVKATDLTGGKGVRKCYNFEEVDKAADYSFSATRNNVIVVEECVVGENHGYTCLLKNHKVVFGFYDDEQYYLNPYLVSGASGPTEKSYLSKVLNNDIEKISRHLNMCDGLFHVQTIVNSDDYPIMIDPCLRMPGDLYPYLVKYSTEVDYPMEIAKSELGLPLQDTYEKKCNFVARECIMTDSTGVYESYSVESELEKKLIDHLVWAKKGEIIDDPLKYKSGILFFKFDTYSEMNDTLSHFYELVKVNKG